MANCKTTATNLFFVLAFRAVVRCQFVFGTRPVTIWTCYVVCMVTFVLVCVAMPGCGTGQAGAASTPPPALHQPPTYSIEGTPVQLDAEGSFRGENGTVSLLDHDEDASNSHINDSPVSNDDAGDMDGKSPTSRKCATTVKRATLVFFGRKTKNC